MLVQRLTVSAIFAAVVVASPAAWAQFYPVCTPNPLSWPFCVAGAAAATAGTILTAPFGGPHPYYYGQPYYAAPRGYVTDGHEPWNRPSPTDHIARQLNRQELARTY